MLMHNDHHNLNHHIPGHGYTPIEGLQGRRNGTWGFRVEI